MAKENYKNNLAIAIRLGWSLSVKKLTSIMFK